MNSNSTTYVRLDPDLKEATKQYAMRNYTSMQQVIVAAIKFYLTSKGASLTPEKTKPLDAT